MDTDREYNDLNKALSFSLRNGAGKAAILGGFGLREDHALGNLGVMMLFAKERNMELEMVTNHGVFTPLLETATLACYPGQQVSVFALYGDPELTFYGLKYPVDRRKFRYLWEGSLNEAVSNRFTIEFDKGDVLVYRSY